MLDILKGAYLASGAVDKTLPVKAGQTIARGDLLVIVDGKFQLSDADNATETGASAKVPYVALVATDRTAHMAGSKLYTASDSPGTALAGSLPGAVDPLGVANAGLDVITAIPLNIDGEFRVSSALTPSVGDLLTFGEAGAFAAGTAGTHTIIGKVTKASTQVYHNFKTNASGTDQGGPVQAIEFASFFVPKMS
jgi:hypothetical protein